MICRSRPWTISEVSLIARFAFFLFFGFLLFSASPRLLNTIMCTRATLSNAQRVFSVISQIVCVESTKYNNNTIATVTVMTDRGGQTYNVTRVPGKSSQTDYDEILCTRRTCTCVSVRMMCDDTTMM